MRSHAHQILLTAALGATTILTHGCVAKIAPSPTSPLHHASLASAADPGRICGAEISYDSVRFRLDDNRPLEFIRFRNLSHPDVNRYWTRKKTDHHCDTCNLLRGLGINWIPAGAPNARDRVDKRTLCGRLHAYEYFQPAGEPDSDERDWNIIIDPSEGYRYLVDDPKDGRWIKQVSKLSLIVDALEFHKDLDERYWHPAETPRADCAHKAGHRCLIEAELTPHPDLRRDNYTFPAGPNTKQRVPLPDVSTQLTDGAVCTYGPWLQEAVHGFRPEIHPTEAIWWGVKSTNTWHLLVAQDASMRFDASDPSGWITARHAPRQLSGEYWVQPRMLGEFLILLRAPLRERRQWTILRESQARLQELANYRRRVLKHDGAPDALQVNIDAPVDAAIVSACHTDTEAVAIVAVDLLLEGAEQDDPLVNRGAFADLVLQESH
jgi:hypothetical protein